MKKKNLFLTTVLGLALGLGVAGGLAANRAAKSVEKVEAATGDTWYLMGSMNGWTASDSYKILEDGDPLVIDLTAGDKFKVATDDWSSELTTSTGDASGNGITFSYGNDSYVDTDGKYAFTVKGGALYADFGEFYYSGDDNSWGIDTSTTGDHPKVVANGGSSTWTLSSGDKFKIRNVDWNKGIFSYSNLVDGDFYGSFYGEDNGNIVCSIAGSYDVSISITNRAWTVRVVPAGVDPDNRSYVYVFDKYANLLTSTHYAHLYDDDGRSTAWPGATMSVYDGTTHVYQIDFWAGMDHVIFNNGTTQSWAWDISGEYSRVGKCLVLDGATEHNDGENRDEWSSTLWIEPETAKFIENYLHFQNFNEEDIDENGACKGESGYYALAKAAYNLLAPAIKEDLCKVDFAVARLSAWASANGESFTITNNVGSFSRVVNPFSALVIENNSSMIIIIIVSSMAVLAVGGYFLLRRKKQK